VGKPVLSTDAGSGFVAASDLGSWAEKAYQDLGWYAGFLHWKYSSDPSGKSIRDAVGKLSTACAGGACVGIPVDTSTPTDGSTGGSGSDGSTGGSTDGGSSTGGSTDGGSSTGGSTDGGTTDGGTATDTPVGGGSTEGSTGGSSGSGSTSSGNLR